jgi:hypothetical protein
MKLGSIGAGFVARFQAVPSKPAAMACCRGHTAWKFSAW